MNVNLIEGKVTAPEGMKVGIIASRFNSFIVEKLLDGAIDGLVRHGVKNDNIDACWVPGAFEIPVLFGVIATENIEQAIERAGSKAGNKGYECALGAIEMVNVMKQL